MLKFKAHQELHSTLEIQARYFDSVVLEERWRLPSYTDIARQGGREEGRQAGKLAGQVTYYKN